MDQDTFAVHVMAEAAFARVTAEMTLDLLRESGVISTPQLTDMAQRMHAMIVEGAAAGSPQVRQAADSMLALLHAMCDRLDLDLET